MNNGKQYNDANDHTIMNVSDFQVKDVLLRKLAVFGHGMYGRENNVHTHTTYKRFMINIDDLHIVFVRQSQREMN